MPATIDAAAARAGGKGLLDLGEGTLEDSGDLQDCRFRSGQYAEKEFDGAYQ